MVSRKEAQERGKKFEDEIGIFLKALEQRNPCKCHRIYDSRSAGNYLPNQPGDYYFFRPGGSVLIECKSSSIHSSLCGNRKAMTDLIGRDQAAHMRLHKRAGGVSLYIFENQENRTYEVWEGAEVAKALATPRKLPDRTHVVEVRCLNDLKDFLRSSMLFEDYFGGS